MKTALRPHRLCIIAIQFDLRLMFACTTAICWTSFWLLMFNMGHVTGMSCLRIFRKPRLCRLCAGKPEAAHSQKQHRCTEASGSLGSVVCLNGTTQGTRCNISWCSTKSLKMFFFWYGMFDHIWSNLPTWPFEAIQHFEDLWYTANCKMIETALLDSGSWTCFSLKHRITWWHGGLSCSVIKHFRHSIHKHTMKIPFWQILLRTTRNLLRSLIAKCDKVSYARTAELQETRHHKQRHRNHRRGHSKDGPYSESIKKTLYCEDILDFAAGE